MLLERILYCGCYLSFTFFICSLVIAFYLPSPKPGAQHYDLLQRNYSWLILSRFGTYRFLNGPVSEWMTGTATNNWSKFVFLHRLESTTIYISVFEVVTSIRKKEKKWCYLRSHLWLFSDVILSWSLLNFCREEENLVFWFGAQFISTLNFTQSGWLILFSPDLHFRLAKRVSGQTHSLWLETATRTDVPLAVPA